MKELALNPMRYIVFLKKINRVINALSANPIFHLLLLTIIAYHCFPLHEYRLFNGLDGVRHLILGKNEWEWWPHRPYMSFNIFQGMANIFYGFNLNWMPVYLIQNIGRGHVGIMASYLLYTTQYFITVYWWARLFCFSKKFSILTSWLLTVCALPFLPTVLIPPQFQTVPQLIDTLFFSTLLLHCFRQIGKDSLWKDTACFIGLIAIFYYLSITSLYFIISVIPVVSLIGFYFLFITDTKRESKIKLLTGVMAIILIFLLEIPQFLYGLVGYSAYSFFTSEIFNPHTSLSDASLLFEYQQSLAYPSWVLFSLIGATMSLNSPVINVRRFARLHLILTIAVVSIGLLGVYTAQKNGKSSEGFYYEMLLWPSYAAYSVYAAYTIFQLLYRYGIISINKIASFIRQNTTCLHCGTPWLPPINIEKSNSPRTNLFLLAIPLLVTLFNHPETSGIPQLVDKPYPQSTLYPPIETPIIRVLRRSIALQQNSTFKGYEASFVPAVTKKKGISWANQADFDNYIESQWGNEHRLDGLWYYDIPTLNEYSHLITPPLYLVETRLLSRPIDKPMRTSVAYTIPNINLLRMLGVSFIITNFPGPFPYSINHDTVLKKKLLIDKTHGYLYLYQLIAPNLGNYSPTHYLIAKTAAKTLALMKQQHFPFRQKVIVSQALPKSLIPASNIRMRVSKAGIHLTATSRGLSTLLIPVQYSHCLKPLFIHQRPYYFSLQRANLVDTLITFSGQLDIYLEFSFGPLYHVHCRLNDIQDMRLLKIRQR